MMALSVWDKLLSLLIVTGCGRAHFDLAADAASNGLDTLVPASGPFGQPMPISVLNTAVADDDPTLTGDLLEVIFDSGTVDDIHVSRRATVDAPWSTPMPIPELMTAGFDEDAPNVSRDGLTLTFTSPRGTTLDDLYVTTRASRTSPWGLPVRIDELATTVSDKDLSMTEDGRIGVFERDAVLYQVTRATATATWDAPVPIPAVNVGGVQEEPMMTSDGLRLVYTQADGVGGDYALYIATRDSTSAPFGPGTLITELQTPDDESDPWLSLDGHTLLYTIGVGDARDIYLATR